MLTIKDVDNWIKNSADFTQFDNVYSESEELNTLTFTGCGGCERIYFPVTVTQGLSLTFSLKFCSPTGFTCQYGDSQDYIAVTKNEPSGSGQITDYQILGRTAVSSAASNDLVEYSVSLTPDYSGTAYLVIDMGYITDNVQIELLYSDISYETEYIWHIKNGELTCDNFYKVSDEEFKPPYPDAYFRIKNDIITNNLIPELQHKQGRPAVQWYINSRKGLINDAIPDKNLRGSFANARNLNKVKIPDSVKFIGEYAFRNTQLTEVMIASDCTYFPTSFPDGCRVIYYESEQVYDKDGFACVDSEGYLCYVKE